MQNADQKHKLKHVRIQKEFEGFSRTPAILTLKN